MPRSEVIWEPSADEVDRSRLTAYVRWLREHRGVAADDYEALWRWSIGDLDGFWSSIVDFCDLRFDRDDHDETVLADRAMPGARWFPGARLNYAEHVFRGPGLAGRDPERVAIRHASELRTLDEWTWGRLEVETAAIAAALRRAGVGRGDRVAAYMPNIPETVAALLATASLGAIWSSAAPEFGPRSVIDRFAQIEPTVLIAVDGYRYGGRDFDRTSAVAEIAAALPGDPTVIRFGYLDGTGWDPTVSVAAGPEAGHEPLRFDRVPFDHPLWILYSSGTTGLPKPIVHGQGGILIEQAKMDALHLDARPEDRVFWFTTTGWMMWNFLVGVLLSDASIVLFDGNPGHPDPSALWQLAAGAQITIFGTSAAYISACMKAHVEPRRGRDLSQLRAVGCTGSPLSDDGFRWLYDQLGPDLWLFSTSGGTDVCTAFVGGVPTRPVRIGELQGRALGAKVEAFDADGAPLVGETGELVITAPMPSMPLFFWGDADPQTGAKIGDRYRDSYFGMYPGVWRHGDWIELEPDGGAIIRGRSDATINRGGVRIGTAEIYAAVLGVEAVLDAIVVDLPKPGTDGSLDLFVQLRPGRELDDDLIGLIRRTLRADCSPRHVPDQIVAVDEVPRTLSGKVLEVPVKRILMGTPVEQAASRESLANPAALDRFAEMAAAGGAATATDAPTDPAATPTDSPSVRG